MNAAQGTPEADGHARPLRLPRPSHWQRLPLRTTLTLAVSTIAAVVLVVIGVATVLGLRTSVLAQLDADLARELSTPVAAWGDATGATTNPPSPMPPPSRTRTGPADSWTVPVRAASRSPRSSSTVGWSPAP